MGKRVSDRIRGIFRSMNVGVCGCHRNKRQSVTIDDNRRPFKRLTKDNFDIITSADEKLRSFGNKGQSTATKLSSYSGSQKNPTPSTSRLGAPDSAPPPIPTNQQPSTQSDATRSQSKSSEPPPILFYQSQTIDLDEPPPIFPRPNLSQMAERRIKVQKDENRLTNSQIRDGQQVSKRRSRSAGPHGRRKMRNSMHETSNVKMHSSKGGRYSMFAEPLSDNDMEIEQAASDSLDSDEAEQKWTKNPLVVKKTRKGDKGYLKSEKRKSMQNVENGFGYGGNMSNGHSYPTGSEKYPQQMSTNSKDMYIFPNKSGSSPGSGQKSKFLRMEENRNKRIDMAVTSDEECSPQLRISRLRQRAMMSSRMFNEKGSRDDMNIIPVKYMGDPSNMSNNGLYPDEISATKNRLSQYDENRLSKYDENENIDNINGQYDNLYAKQQRIKHDKVFLPNILPEFMPQGRQSRNPQTVPVMPSAGVRSNNRRDMSRLIDSQYAGKTNAPVQVHNGSEKIQNPRGTQSTTRVKLASESPPLRSFQEVKTNQPAPLKKAVEKIELNPRSPNSSSDDSLDELIESNIQYLESEIESGKLKRQSGNFSNFAADGNIDRRLLRGEPVRGEPMRGEPMRGEPMRMNMTNQDEIRARLQAPISRVANRSATRPTTIESIQISKPLGAVHASGSNKLYQQSVPQNFKPEHKNMTSGSATYSPHMQRKSREYNEDLSKSDSQLNALDMRFVPNQKYFPVEKSVAPYPILNKETGNIMYVQPDDTDEHIANRSNSFPNVDAGMFSDVEYNIEVSERIKKWEKKLTPGELEEQRRVLKTIQEYESFSDSNQCDKILPETPLEIRRELRQLVSPTDNSGVGKLSVNLTKSTSSILDSRFNDPASLTYHEPKVVSSETNLHRIFRVVHDPKPQTSTRSTDALYQHTSAANMNNVVVQRRKKRSGSDVSTYQPQESSNFQSLSNTALSESEAGSNMQQSWPPMLIDSDSGIRKSWRMSRYEDEINELKEIVSDNFRDLKKKFDSDVSETDTKRATSPVRNVLQTEASPIVTAAPVTLNLESVTPRSFRSPDIRRRRTTEIRQQQQQQQQQQQKQQQPLSSQTIQSFPSQSTKPEQKIPIYKTIPIETRSKAVLPVTEMKPTTIISAKSAQVLDTKPAVVVNSKPLPPDVWSDTKPAVVVNSKPLPPDVWSPHMESRQGLISIERVKARTLQTIPFSEDPVWKEIEGLASFEKPEELATKEINFDDIDALLKLATGGIDSMESERLARSKPEEDSQMMTKSFSHSKSEAQLLDLPHERPRKLSDSSLMSSSSKHSFTPPAIQPLKLSVSPGNKSSASALDEVLEDIRASLQKKPLSPKILKNLDTSETNSSANLSLQSPLSKSTKAFVFSKADLKSKMDQSANVESDASLTSGYDNTQSSWQENRTESQPPKIPDVPYIDPEFTQLPYIINGNYHLDPSLLTEKLQKTGLVKSESSDDHASIESKLYRVTTDLPANHNALRQKFQNQDPLPANQMRQKKISQSNTSLQDVDQSVDDLKSLAQEVEFKLSQIKSRIVSADEDRLDSILLALRKFAPTTEQTFFNTKATPNYESQKYRKNKLEDALTELEKMYESLDLDDPALLDRASRVEETLRRPEAQKVTNATSTNVGTVMTNGSKPYDSKNGSMNYDGKILRRSQIDEIERQTQNEFEDITNAFQVLLDEVTKQCKTVAQGSSKYDRSESFSSSGNTGYSSRLSANEARSDNSQYKYESQSQRAVQDSYNTAIKELESVAAGTTKVTSSQPKQSSVYLNISASPTASQKINQNIKNSDLTSLSRGLDIQLQSRAITSAASIQPKVTMASASAQSFSMATEFKPVMISSRIRDGSTSDNQIKDTKVSKSDGTDGKTHTRGGRFRKRMNAEHRKSMPAMTRTVETQTIETQTDPISPVSSVNDADVNKDQNSIFTDAFNDPVANLSDIVPKRKMSSGIAKMVDLFSSSEDELGRETQLKHSLSAPDLVALCEGIDESYGKKAAKIDKAFAKSAAKGVTPRSVKHRHEAKSRFRSLQKDDVHLKQLDIMSASAVSSTMTSSITSEDGIDTPTSKPPVYPVWKYPGQGETPSPKKPDKKFAFEKDIGKISSDSERERIKQRETTQMYLYDPSLVRRRTRSVGSDHEDEDRPKSFHELVATFEQNPQRLEKMRTCGLRKCASEDSMFTDLVLQKIYHSESDVSQVTSPAMKRKMGTGPKLALEMKVKT